jgi:hypothetical protein
MSKSTDQFKTTIQAYLNKRAEEDSLFANTLKKENKNIDDCIQYIFSEVQKSGCTGFADDEIYGMAVHYYDEDDVKPGSYHSPTVVVNHSVELSPEELDAAKQKGIDAAMEEARQKALEELPKTIKLSPEEVAAAKQQALNEAIKEQKDKLLQKKSKKQETVTEAEPDLFGQP